MVERQQYAAWKAADIRKALREGRVPTAGPPVNEDMLDLPEVPGRHLFCWDHKPGCDFALYLLPYPSHQHAAA